MPKTVVVAVDSWKEHENKQGEIKSWDVSFADGRQTFLAMSMCSIEGEAPDGLTLFRVPKWLAVKGDMPIMQEAA